MTSGAIDQMHLMSQTDFRIMEPQQIIVAKSILKPGIKTSLESFILSTNKAKDREKALEILHSIEDYNKRYQKNYDLVREYKLKKALQRPKTACSRLQNNSFIHPFSTTYSEDYPTKPMEETIATRPGSTQNIIARPNNSADNESEFKDNVDMSYKVAPENPIKICSIYKENSTYTNDYCSKNRPGSSYLKNHPPNRAATASGNRCNNPHPSKAFLVWRFPRESISKETRVPCATALKSNMENNFAQITDEQFNRVMRGQCRSTYQADFVGGAISADHYAPYYLHPEIKTGKKLKISTQRVDYDRPKSLPSELSVPKDRYSSNKVKSESAKGIIPKVTNKTYMNTFTRTTYDEDINDRAQIIQGQIINDIQKKVDLSRLHNMKDLERAMVEAGSINDKETLERIFRKLNEPEDFKRISFVRKPFYNTGKMNWLSDYPGPL